jgi:CheY-like chemotaxis protein
VDITDPSHSELANGPTRQKNDGFQSRTSLIRLIYPPKLPIEKAKASGRVKILLVDDSKPILHENARVLQKAGYEVICAEDGESVMKLAREHKPDLILLDMILPKLSGPEVLEALKEHSATASIPVVVLSSLTQKNRQKLIEAGAEDYIEKNTLMPTPGVNVLPNVLEDVICRINRKRGVAFSKVPLSGS